MSFAALPSMQASAPPASALPTSALIRVQSGDNELRLIFNSVMSRPAPSANGLDTWTVEVQASGTTSPPAAFTHTTPAGVHPHPHRVLACVASDLKLAMAMPAATGPALDWLYNEGYATLPSDTVDLHERLTDTLNATAMILEGSGITLAQFTACASALPLVRQVAPAFA